MTLGKVLKTCLKDKYCCFKGRATRSEFWFFAIFYILISVPLNFIGYSLAELYFFSTYDYTYYTVMILFLIAFNLFLLFRFGQFLQEDFMTVICQVGFS